MEREEAEEGGEEEEEEQLMDSVDATDWPNEVDCEHICATMDE